MAAQEIGERAFVVKEACGVSDVGFRLCHHRHIQENKRLAQMMIRAERAHGTRGHADDGGRLAVPCTLAVGTRPDIDGIL